MSPLRDLAAKDLALFCHLHRLQQVWDHPCGRVHEQESP